MYLFSTSMNLCVKENLSYTTKEYLALHIYLKLFFITTNEANYSYGALNNQCLVLE